MKTITAYCIVVKHNDGEQVYEFDTYWEASEFIRKCEANGVSFEWR